MHRNFPHFARRRRQILNLESKLNRWLANGRWWQLDEAKRQTWLNKLKASYRAFREAGLKKWVKPALMAALLGIGTPSLSQAQNFTGPQLNPFGLSSLTYVSIPTMVDIDADGDLDVFSGDLYGTINFFENTTANPSVPAFAPIQVNPFGIVSANTIAAVAFADLDMDGDQDLLVGEYYGNFQYYQNTGTNTAPAFAAPVQNPFGLTAAIDYVFPTLADLDGDGDFDLLVGDYGGDLKYYQNTGTATAPTFAAPQVNPFGLTASIQDFQAPHFIDLDVDGDLDVLAGEYYGAMQYYENTGTSTAPAFAAPQLNPFGLQSAYDAAFIASGDLDNDGDFDLLVGERYGTHQYYENNSATAGNTPPTISTILDQTLCAGDSIGPLMFMADDANGDSLSFLVSSSNQALLADADIQISGMTPNYQLVGFPMPGQLGTTTITVAVTDGIDTTTTSFVSTVNLCNSAPVLTGIADQTNCSGDTLSGLAFTASDPDNDSFSLVATSNNQALIPDANIVISGAAPNYSLSFNSVLGQIGQADCYRD
ncbi:MAG: FG-GAP-like repeat-containing protein [Bacteroidota bacterium]